MNQITSISILGCGWLGLSLAETLLNDKYQVKGSTTSKNKISILERKGIQPFLFSLPLEAESADTFFNSEVILLSIPPKSGKEGVNYHLDCIISIINSIPSSKTIIYTSSISVYKEQNSELTEESEVNWNNERSAAILKVEDTLRKHFQSKLIILRLGGLMGYDRIPAKYFDSREVPQANKRVNYIHRDDVVNMIVALLKKTIKAPEVFNMVAPKHPTKEAVIREINKEKRFNIKSYKRDCKRPDQTISSQKIIDFLDYTFIYPDPLHFDYTF